MSEETSGMWKGKLRFFDTKSGKTNGLDWSLYIMGVGKQKFVTFEPGKALKAQRLSKKGRVKIEWRLERGYQRVVSVEAVDRAGIDMVR